MEYLERAFDDAKYGWYSKRPYIDMAIQSIVDPDMAPPGKHVMSCFIQYAPYHLKGSDWDTERDRFGDTVQATLESFFPGFGDLVLHREVVTPLDIERVVGLTEGNIFAGEFLAPQMYFFRPAPGWSQYRTPIEGYYQCGSGTHPGGCVMGAPGQARQPADPARPLSQLIAFRCIELVEIWGLDKLDQRDTWPVGRSHAYSRRCLKRWCRIGRWSGSIRVGGMTSGMPSVAITTAHSPWWMRWWWKWQSRHPFARSVGPPSSHAWMWWASVQAGGRSQLGKMQPWSRIASAMRWCGRRGVG